MTFEQFAARLAGGFSRPIDDDAVRKAISSVLEDTGLDELDGIKTLPGRVNAAIGTLRQAWRTSIDLGSCTGEHPRLGSIAAIVKVRWIVGPWPVRPWLDGNEVDIVRTP